MSSANPILVALTLIIAALSATGNVYGKDEGVGRALLIGINKYQQLPSLAGSRNDVEVMREILVSRFGFLNENVQITLDEQATRAGILGALEKVVAESGPNDIVYIHYSGHGSQVADQSGDEEDALDETLCPYDARTDNVPDITDDELNQILGKLRVASALIVLDSCHSGTALRGAVSDIRVRAIPQDMRHELYKSQSTVTRGVTEVRGEAPYVLFSASAANQEELDGPFGPNGEPLGLLTAAMSRSLQSTKTDMSPRQLLTAVEQVVEKLKPIFAGYPVPEAQLEGQVRLIDLPLFSPVPRKTEPALTFPTPSAHEKQKTGNRLFVKYKDSKRLRRALSKRIGTEIEWVYSADRADVVIDCTIDNRCDVFGPRGIVRVARIPDIGRMFQSNSTLNENGERVVSAIADIAMTAPAVAELLAIDEPTGALVLNMSAIGRRGTGAEPLGTRGIKLTASVANHHIRFYSSNDPRTNLNSLQLSITTDTPCYLTLVSVDSAGTVMQLLPNPLQEQSGFIPDGFIRPKKKILIPDSLGESNLAGFYMDYAPPAGTETIRAFCAADIGVAQSLRQSVAQITRGRRDASVGQSLVTGRGLTGLSPKQSTAKHSAWGAATITVDISNQ